MNPYPNSGDPNQPNQYPANEGSSGTPYGGSSQIPPNVPAGYGDQSIYQQQGYQQPPYQQNAYQQPPYQQAPYEQPYQQQVPYPQSKNTVALDWRYLTAGIGGLVSLIAFFLPYYTYGTAGGTYYGISIPDTSFSLTGAQLGRQLILDIIIAIAAIVIVLLLQFGSQIFKTPTSPTIQKLANSLNAQTRTWGLALLAIGAFGIFFRFILDLTALSTWGYGSWLYLLGMIAVTVGGFFVFRQPNATPTQVPPIR